MWSWFKKDERQPLLDKTKNESKKEIDFFSKLPATLHSEIISHLDFKTIAILAQTNSRMHKIVEENRLECNFEIQNEKGEKKIISKKLTYKEIREMLNMYTNKSQEVKNIKRTIESNVSSHRFNDKCEATVN